MISKSSARRVQSVQTGFQLISTLQNRDGATLNELAEELGLAKSTVHNYLNTLESMGYVVKHGDTYRIGLRFLTHGMAAKNGLGITDAMNGALQEITESISQSTWWITEEFGRGIFVEKAIPDSSQRIYGRVGKRSYLHTHGPGKAILARLPESEVERITEHHGLPVHTVETTTDPEILREELDEIRKQGYAFTDGEAALGVQSIGVAFEDPWERLHAVGVFGYSHDFDGEHLDPDIPSLLRTKIDDVLSDLQAGGA